jgi:hypothetical protein
MNKVIPTLIVIFIGTLVSCDKDATSSQNSLELSASASISSTNPYAYVGEAHNDQLDFYIDHLELIQTESDLINVTSLYSDLNGLSAEVDSVINASKYYFQVHGSGLLSNFLNDAIQNFSISQVAFDKLNMVSGVIDQSIINIYDSLPENPTQEEVSDWYKALDNDLQAIELSCMNTTFQSNDEKKLVLSTIAVTRSSLSYWVKVATDINHPYHQYLLSLSGSFKTTGFIRKLLEAVAVVVLCDALGALTGAVFGLSPLTIGVMAGVGSGLAVIALII